MIDHDSMSVLERQLLLQLGDRLKQLRKSQGIGTVKMAERAGFSRTTLSAIESGSPGPSMGNYLRVMSVLGVSGELALLAGDTFQPAPAGTAAARSTRGRPEVTIHVRASRGGHGLQDLQSLALHEAALRALERDPALLENVQDTLARWMAQAPASRSMSLWKEWEKMLARRAFRKALGPTQRAKELRQASPLVTILPEADRLQVLDHVRLLKKGVVLGHGGVEESEPQGRRQ